MMILIDSTGLVAASGHVTRRDDGMFVCGDTLYPPDMQLIDATPPGPGMWRYADGEFVAVVPVLPKPTLADFDAALTAHLDAVAQARRYDNRITCMVRAGFAGPFQAEAIAFAQWCDACNATAYKLLSEVQAGVRPMPDSPKELIDVLPVMEWPK